MHNKNQPRMKKILFILLFYYGFAINASSYQSPASEEKELTGRVIYSKATVPKSKRSPMTADIVLLISDESISISIRGDHGCGTFQMSDSATGESFSCEVNSSSQHIYSIPYIVTSSSDLDFTIEFEDGSWCCLTWNGQ